MRRRFIVSMISSFLESLSYFNQNALFSISIGVTIPEVEWRGSEKRLYKTIAGETTKIKTDTVFRKSIFIIIVF